MKVRLVTTWDTPCGVAEHAYYLKTSIEAADAGIEVTPDTAALDPNQLTGDFDLLHLNYHGALHSRWLPKHIKSLQARRVPVITTFHDTGVPNSDLCKVICAASTAAVVHEPFDDLEGEVYYWRMGVPEVVGQDHPHPFSGSRPVLGTVGFNFGWKCYDELCRVTERVGWGMCIISPNATEADEARWKAINPWVDVVPGFVSREAVVLTLKTCDATAFTYVCHNTGQSGAILQGIAAKKPVFALETCRQFRALLDDDLGSCAIHWCQTFEHVAETLRWLPLTRLDSAIVQLAHQDRWSEVGKRYASLYRRVAARP